MSFKMSGPSLYPNIKRSTSGYRDNSEHKEEKELIIKSNEISMHEDDGSDLKKGDIKGTGLTTGNTKIMKPGKNYKFAGDNEVLETPMAKKGCTCWKTHERVPGTKPCASGSCRKK
tara:strand:- start:410 stop:757 length:348 start_codon:yes stop_codon:yes gene_type:complete